MIFIFSLSLLVLDLTKSFFENMQISFEFLIKNFIKYINYSKFRN